MPLLPGAVAQRGRRGAGLPAGARGRGGHLARHRGSRRGLRAGAAARPLLRRPGSGRGRVPATTRTCPACTRLFEVSAEGGAVISDAGARNGTWVNGARGRRAHGARRRQRGADRRGQASLGAGEPCGSPARAADRGRAAGVRPGLRGARRDSRAGGGSRRRRTPPRANCRRDGHDRAGRPRRRARGARPGTHQPVTAARQPGRAGCLGSRRTPSTAMGARRRSAPSPRPRRPPASRSPPWPRTRSASATCLPPAPAEITAMAAGARPDLWSRDARSPDGLVLRVGVTDQAPSIRLRGTPGD